jgi:cytochrome c oxidase assembly protein subunit 15
MKEALIFKRLVLVASLLAICVVVLGAYVRLSDAGLGCPDWPGCYGTLSVPESSEAIANAEKTFQAKVHVGKAWKEMLHRYLAGTLGVLVLLICVTAWLGRQHLRTSPWLSTCLLLLITFQALLGMWTVTLLLKPAVVSAHLIGGMSTLALLVWIAHRHWGYSLSSLDLHKTRLFARFAIVLLFAQIFLGGWTSSNYAALACTDFPTCHGALVPQLDFINAFHMVRDLGMAADGGTLKIEALETIQWVHRVGALVVFIYFTVLAYLLHQNMALRTLSKLLFAVLLIQVILGISNLVLHLPLPLAVGHNMFAALLLALTIIVNSKLTRNH